MLSGFVIAYCRENKENTLREYAVNRASRIYSVAVPTIFITIVLDLACAQLAPERFGAFYDFPLVRILSSLAFTNELWFLSIQSFSNTPYWSINYEVWYYVLFGILAYVTRFRLYLFALACLIAGPKLLLLAPCWWFGVWIYHTEGFNRLSRGRCLALYLCSAAAFGIYIHFRVGWFSWDALESILSPEHFRLLAFSRHFMSDYALTVIVGINFGAARALLRDIDVPTNRMTRTIRMFAGATFALYLLHQPFLHFFDVLFVRFSLEPAAHHLWVSVTCLTVVLIAGYQLERSKEFYRQTFNRLTTYLGTWIARRAPDWLSPSSRPQD